MLLFLEGCCISNPFIGAEAAFNNGRDANIGNPIKHIIEWFPWMADRKFDRSTDTYGYHVGEKGYCEFVYIVDKQSMLIVDWEQISKPGTCRASCTY